MTRDQMECLIRIAESPSVTTETRKIAHDKIVAYVDAWLAEQDRKRETPSFWARVRGWLS